MQAIFLETSGWAKAYICEPEHAEILGLLHQAELVVTTTIAYVEIYSAISRANPAGRLVGKDLDEVVRRFEKD